MINYRTIIRILFLFLSFFFVIEGHRAYAQYYLVGQDPASVRWNQINTENFQVVFPEGFDQQANLTALKLELAINEVAKAYAIQPKKISLILHNQTMVSNGFVSWAPSRMEFYTTPNQDMNAQDWIDQLVIHELRHVVQMNKVEQEMPQILRILFGEQAAPAITGLYLPFWFLEGDAVITETAKSKSGRGRVPSFGMEMKALLVEKGVPSYDQMYLGSFNHFLPNEYNMGYHFLSGVQEEYGADIWNTVVEHVANRPFSGRALTRALKKNTGYNKVPLYNQVFADFREQWRKEMKQESVSDVTVISPPVRHYTQYRYPYQRKDGKVIALRYGYDKIAAFVELDKEGNESILYQPGSWSSESVSITEDNILWIESMNNPRWSFKENSRLYILTKGEKKPLKIDLNGRYFAPSLSPNSKTVAFVECREEYKFFLSFLELQTKRIMRSVEIPNARIAQTPFWAEDNSIYFVTASLNGKSIMKYDFSADRFTQIIEEQFNEIQRPFVSKNELYFTATNNGKDDIYSYDLTTQQQVRIGSSRYGFRDVSISKNQKVIASNYSSDGYQVVTLPSIREEAIEGLEADYPLANLAVENDPGAVDFSKIDSTKQYAVKRYKKGANLFRLHSWAPVSINIEDEAVKPGVSVLSQNNLSTMTAQLGYEYDLSDEVGRWYGNLTYYGWYPVFDLEVDYQKVKSSFYQITESDTILTSTTLENIGSELSVSIPFDLSVGKWGRTFQPKLSGNWTRWIHGNNTPDSYFEGDVFSLDGQLYFSNLRQSAYRDVQTRWGQILNLEYIESIGGDRDYGRAFGAETYFYTPGFFEHQGIRWYAAYQKKTMGERLWGDIINRASGIGSISNDQMITLSAKYSLPLFHPDWSLGGLIYFRRFTASLFYDYSNLDALFLDKNDNIFTSNLNLHSYGGELKTNCNFVRFKAPAQLGARFIYLPDFNDFRTELIFSIYFSGL